MAKYLIEEALLQKVLNYISNSRSNYDVGSVVTMVDEIRALKPEPETQAPVLEVVPEDNTPDQSPASEPGH